MYDISLHKLPDDSNVNIYIHHETVQRNGSCSSSSPTPASQVKRTEVTSVGKYRPRAIQCCCQANTAALPMPWPQAPWHCLPTPLALPSFQTTSGLWRLEDGPKKSTEVPGRMEREASNKDEKQMEVKQSFLWLAILLDNSFSGILIRYTGLYAVKEFGNLRNYF